MYDSERLSHDVITQIKFLKMVRKKLCGRKKLQGYLEMEILSKYCCLGLLSIFFSLELKGCSYVKETGL